MAQKDLVPLTKGSNIGKGRPKRALTMCKEKGYTKDDVRACFKEIITYTKQELVDTVKNEELPIITRIIANQCLGAFEQQYFGHVKEVMEFAIGKPKQEVEQTSIVVDKRKEVSDLFPDIAEIIEE